jgi:alkylation response protein AidB-like acyl-CoA dehydrogenase
MAAVLDRLDLPPGLAEEEAMLVRTVRQLATEVIAPRAAHYDRTAEFPWENVKGAVAERACDGDPRRGAARRRSAR